MTHQTLTDARIRTPGPRFSGWLALTVVALATAGAVDGAAPPPGVLFFDLDAAVVGQSLSYEEQLLAFVFQGLVNDATLAAPVLTLNAGCVVAYLAIFPNPSSLCSTPWWWLWLRVCWCVDVRRMRCCFMFWAEIDIDLSATHSMGESVRKV